LNNYKTLKHKKITYLNLNKIGSEMKHIHIN